MRGVFIILAVVVCAYGSKLPVSSKSNVPSVLVEKPIQPPPRVVVIDRKIPTNSKIHSIEKVIPLAPETITVERTVAVPLPPKVITFHKEIVVSHPVLVDKPVLLPPKIITIERRIPIPTPVIVERPVPIPSPVIILRDVPIPIYRPYLHPIASQVKQLPPLKLRDAILAATLNKRIVGPPTILKSKIVVPPPARLLVKGGTNAPLKNAPLKLAQSKLSVVKVSPSKLALAKSASVKLL